MIKDELKNKLSDLKSLFQLDQKRQKLANLQILMQKPDFWAEKDQAVQVSQSAAELQKEINDVETLELLLKEEDLSQEDFEEAEKMIAELENKALFSDPHDSESAILSVHAGTGGVDAMDWAEMLSRMYLRFLERQSKILGIDTSSWQVKVIDRSLGEEAGIKSLTVIIQGSYSYGLLKQETGVHRLVRLSPFNAKNLRQTSFALVEVLPLTRDSDKLEIPETDIRIDVFRSSGHGGQSVNTTDSAVRITHLPTGISASVQNERSQHQNKETAMQILLSKLTKVMEEEKKEKIQELRGEVKQAVWGNQIRSYILQPYKLAKDHRTEFETSEVEKVLDGEIEGFIEAELKSDSNPRI